MKYKFRIGGIEAQIGFSIWFPGYLSIASSYVCNFLGNLKILKNVS